ncbi:unnamed protein product [Medioppia subpectinata]|uniref:Uncharacterized protein n=1 Tax=Medioppia subpectinata TaxID=1979941 RepID=A0A7R9QCY8_9ACAR|nr:unnamed protein product [Medioppia subpectinata]CAG2118612.1 unnamed protein product [Medioppia subpectinata]
MGPSLLICRNGTWIPDPMHLMSTPVDDLFKYSTLKLKMPYCSNSTENTVQNVSSILWSFTIALIMIIRRIFFDFNL